MRFSLKFLIISAVFSFLAIISARQNIDSVESNSNFATSYSGPGSNKKHEEASEASTSSEALKSDVSRNHVPAFCSEDPTQDCSKVYADCISCKFNESCVYGERLDADCELKPGVDCTGERKFKRSYLCAYCYQLPETAYTCHMRPDCRGDSKYVANCSVNQNVLCLGRRIFSKKLTCNFVSGYRWSTALILSITLGGFGVDRFYLGNWQEGIGKLFSFGGLGVWTLVDIILIATGYLKPADGSRYM